MSGSYRPPTHGENKKKFHPDRPLEALMGKFTTFGRHEASPAGVNQSRHNPHDRNIDYVEQQRANRTLRCGKH